MIGILIEEKKREQKKLQKSFIKMLKNVVGCYIIKDHGAV